jgi:LAS superfamily LD-carboxypeptidase LdcB
MADIIRDSTPEVSYFRQRDIYNDRQKIRIDALRGLSATQKWIEILRTSGFRHYTKINANQQVEGVF